MDRPIMLLCLAGMAASACAAEPAVVIPEAGCLEAAASYNRIPPELLRAVRHQEGGRTGTWHRNVDGSVDYGVMQINSRWLPVLKPQGYSAAVLTYDACANLMAGAWILAHALDQSGAWNRSDIDGRIFWGAVGDYHSHAPSLNRAYAVQVWGRYRRLMTAGARP